MQKKQTTRITVNINYNLENYYLQDLLHSSIHRISICRKQLLIIIVYRNIQLDPVSTHEAAKLPFEQHALVLFSSEDNSKATTKYVNEALRRGQLTVYAPVNTDNNNNASHTSKVESEIIKYEDNVNRGNLLTLDIRSFYNFLLSGDQQPFEELRVLLEEAIRERIASDKNDEITFVSGIAGTLAANQKFDESINAEKWWQKTHSEWLQKGLKVTMICSHPSTIFDKNQFIHYKQTISSLHDITLDPVSR